MTFNNIFYKHIIYKQTNTMSTKNTVLNFLYTTGSPTLAAKLRTLRKMNKQIIKERNLAFNKFIHLSNIKEKKQIELIKVNNQLVKLFEKRNRIIGSCKHHRKKCGEQKEIQEQVRLKKKEISKLVKQINEINRKLNITNNTIYNSNYGVKLNIINNNQNTNSNCNSVQSCKNSQCSNCIRFE